jgi:ADP-heptose:LPS heptosyltransferase
VIRRLALIKPCCIGDVIFATALLAALRRGYPDAEIDWIVGSSALPALRDHPDLREVLDSGPLANPASKPASLLNLIRLLRSGNYDLAVVPDRSPLMGLAPLLAGIPRRAGLDSAGRGFAYIVKARVEPGAIRHEAEIYLDIARALGLSTDSCWVNIPPGANSVATVERILREAGASPKPLIVVHPGGGVNAGMTMIEKRWPADRFAALADRIAESIDGQIVLIGLKSDRLALELFRQRGQHPILDLTEKLSLPETGALASLAALYIGNDNGVAHLAAASGGKVLMIFGPSDPRRYAPFVPPDRARVVWHPVNLPAQGVSAGVPLDFSWDRDGATVEEAWQAVQPLLRSDC